MKDLPPLPPVPAGYKSWRLCGWGGLTGRQGDTPWARFRPVPNFSNRWSDAGAVPKLYAPGRADEFYILAVKYDTQFPSIQNMNTTQSELAALRAKHTEMGNQIASMEAKAAAEAPKKWEPKGGKYWISSAGRSLTGFSNENDRLAGSEYPTKEAADSALPFVVFFKRLCCLAAELNPSGKVGGKYAVFNTAGVWSKVGPWTTDREVLCVLETPEAAAKAADIMNRDGWTVPSV